MSKVDTDTTKIDEILDRGIIVNILPDKEEFRKKLLSGDRLRFYIGVDPTSSSLHLSHAKNYMLLEEFRLLGHEVITLFGDFTARIGDPTDKDSTRTQLSADEVKHNVEQWKKQISPLMDFDAQDNPPLVKYNSDWLASLTFEQLIDLASNFTVQQMIERDMFQKRLSDNKPIYLHEFFYPLMQGYDSVAMEVDVELCGTDQTFNAMAGRTLSKRLNNKDKFVVVVNLMENPKTKELMSKSQGTGVFLDTSAEEMFGAVMAQPDEMTEILLINNTRLPLGEIAEIIAGNPRDAKLKTAREIVSIFHGAESAAEAQTAWISQFSEGNLPQDMPELRTAVGEREVVDILVEAGIVTSRSEARRLVDQGAVKLNGSKIDSDTAEIKEGDVLQAGKRRFVRIRLN